MRRLHAWTLCLFGAVTGLGCGKTPHTPCELGVRRACETESGKRGSQVCDDGGDWSPECEPVNTVCSKEECDRYGLCRLSANTPTPRTGAHAALADNIVWVDGVEDRNREYHQLAVHWTTPEGYETGDPVRIRMPSKVPQLPLTARITAAHNQLLVAYERRAATAINEAGYLLLDSRGDRLAHIPMGELFRDFDHLVKYPQSVVATDEGFQVLWAERKGSFWIDTVRALSRTGELSEVVEIEPLKDFYLHHHLWTGEEHIFVTGDNECWIERRSIDGKKTAEPLGVSSPMAGYGPCRRGSQPAAVWNGIALGLLWAEPQDEVSSIYFVELALDDAAPAEPLLVAQAPTVVDTLRLLWDGAWSGFWTERVHPESRVLARRIDPSRPDPYENLVITSVLVPWGLEATLSDGAMSSFWYVLDADGVTIRPYVARVDTCK